MQVPCRDMHILKKCCCLHKKHLKDALLTQGVGEQSFYFSMEVPTVATVCFYCWYFCKVKDQSGPAFFTRPPLAAPGNGICAPKRMPFI